MISIGFFVVPLLEPSVSIFFTTSLPSVTAPKMTCLPSSHGVATVVMKNYAAAVHTSAVLLRSVNQ